MALLLGTEHKDMELIHINYPRINSRVCSSHPVLDSGNNVFRLPPKRLHHRAVDNARYLPSITRQMLVY